MKKIGYAKLGRSMGFDPGKFGFQGDAEAPQLLTRLAKRNPDVEFVLLGKHGPINIDLPSNVSDPWPAGLPRAFWHHMNGGYVCSHCKTPLAPETLWPGCCEKGYLVGQAEYELRRIAAEELDGMIVHLGQHGTSNSPILEVRNREKLTAPQVWSRNFGGYLVQSLNVMRPDAPVTYICTDPRNYLKARDIASPRGTDRILAQHQFERGQLHESYGPEGAVTYQHKYRHADLEFMILPDDWETWGPRGWDDRDPIGVATTAFWSEDPKFRRSWYVNKYVWEQYGEDVVVSGKWDDRSTAEALGKVVTKSTGAFVDDLGSWRTTVALPAPSRSQEGIKWTTAKPWQAFAARTVCFFLGPLDAQGWMLPSKRQAAGTKLVADGLWSVREDWTEDDLQLARWLRPESPDQFKKMADAAQTSRDTWEWLVYAQRNLLQRRWDQHFLERCIEHQMGITS